MVYQKLGSELTVVEATPTLLPGVDPECAAVVEKKLVKHGAKIFKNAKAMGYEKNADGSLAVQGRPRRRQERHDRHRRGARRRRHAPERRRASASRRSA